MATKAATKARQKKAEDLTDLVYMGSAVFFLIAGFLPVIVAMLIGLIAGTAPDEAQGGMLGAAPGYPAFNPQSWLLFPPALAMLFLAVWTVPLPLRSFPGASRASLAWACFIGTWLTFMVGGAFHGAPGIANEGVWAGFLLFLAWVLFMLRIILGGLKLVPRRWREAVPTKRRSRTTKIATPDA